MEPPETVGTRIRAARKSLRLDQRSLAAAAHTHVTTVSRWENDVMVPDSSTLGLVAERLSVDAGWLLTGKAPSAQAPGWVVQPPEPSSQAEAAERVLRSHAVRVWLADFRSELTRARATEEEIDSALRVAASPDVLTFYSRGRLRALTEADAITALEAIATPIRAELKRRGRKFG